LLLGFFSTLKNNLWCTFKGYHLMFNSNLTAQFSGDKNLLATNIKLFL